MDRVAQQPNRPGEDSEQQLDQAGSREADRADGNRAVCLPPLVGIIPAMRQRERSCRVALSSSLVHGAQDSRKAELPAHSPSPVLPPSARGRQLLSSGRRVRG